MYTAQNGEMVLVPWSVIIVIVGCNSDVGPDTCDVNILGKGDGAAGVDSHVARGNHALRFGQSANCKFALVVDPYAAA